MFRTHIPHRGFLYIAIISHECANSHVPNMRSELGMKVYENQNNCIEPTFVKIDLNTNKKDASKC